jgi:uncharacterized protein (TIGR02145 family)
MVLVWDNLLKQRIMKKVIKLSVLTFITAFLIIFNGCKKDAGIPALTTADVSMITTSTATTGGIVTSDGGAEVTFRGVCWSTSHNPTVNDNKSTIESGYNTFSINIENLTPNTTYYVRAYATNSAGTSYGNEVYFATFILDLNFGSLSDTDGNIYKTIQIGTQVWMAENLKTTKYNDITSIPNVTGDMEWYNSDTGAFCWYNNNASAYKDTYGVLYNWYAISTGKLCPAGWHVPSIEDWTILTTFLGGEDVAGGKLKEIGTTHWKRPNKSVYTSNETGFTALPGGWRAVSGDLDGGFFDIATTGMWWTSTVGNEDYGLHLENWGYGVEMYFNSSAFFYGEDWGYSNSGLSVRCVKDN